MTTPATIQEKRQKIRETFKDFDNVKLIDVQKTYSTWEELHQSPEWIKMWDGWQGKATKERINLGSKLNTAFIIDGRIYADYEINEGFSIFAEKTVSSMLSNAGFHEFSYIEVAMLIMISKKNYENCQANRKIFKKRNLKVTTEYFSFKESI